MSSQISTTLPPKSTLSGFDKVSNILLKKKLPFEIVEIVFEFLPTTYLESTLDASLEQLISYSKHTTFYLLEKQLRGGYEITHDGTKEIIDYLLFQHFGSHNITNFAYFNRLDLCEIVYSETDAFNGIDSVVDQASFYGKFEIVKYLTGMGASCTTYAMDNAAQCGHLVIVQWLHFNRSEGCSTNAIDLAAQNGHLDIVKWLHLNRSEGCSTDAMRSKHIAIVRYLFENGLVTDRQELKSALEFAQNFGRHVIAEYLKSVLEQKI